ncbi:hypothetical protein KIPB_010143, partial [Kipferlia bialata]|eukprot:g10143.t1
MHQAPDSEAFRHLSDPNRTLEWRRSCKEQGVCCVCQAPCRLRTCEGLCAKTYKRWCATASRLEKAAKEAGRLPGGMVHDVPPPPGSLPTPHLMHEYAAVADMSQREREREMNQREREREMTLRERRVIEKETAVSRAEADLALREGGISLREGEIAMREAQLERNTTTHQFFPPPPPPPPLLT